MLNSHSSTLNNGWDDSDGKLDPPSVVTSQGNTNTVGDELTTCDSNRLNSDHGTSESGRSEFTNVDRGDCRCSSDT